MPIKRLLILGTGVFAEEVADVAASGTEYEPVGFVENWDRGRCNARLNGLPVHWIDDIGELARDHWAICSLATPDRWAFVEQVAARNVPFATLVHPGATLAPSSSVGEGAFLGPGVIVAARAALGRHVRVNRGAMIGHHTTVGDFATIQPGANIAGCCRIGPRARIGIGAILTERLTIGADSMICAGAVVTKAVPDGAQVAGRPARVSRELRRGLRVAAD